jgi:hypothetical protein
LCSNRPNLWDPNPGEAGGLENGFGGGKPGDIGGFESSSGARPMDGGGFSMGSVGKLGDGGGLGNESEANPGEGGGFDNELADDAKPESVCMALTPWSNLTRPNLPGSDDSSAFPGHEKLEGADDGPGEMGSPLLGVEFPRDRAGLLSGLTHFETGPSVGRGAVKGSFGDTSMLSAD